MMEEKKANLDIFEERRSFKMDIKFVNEEGIKFNFRVAGIFKNGNKVLLQKNKKDANYYSLIGGRVKYLEDTKKAFIREVNEEVGVLLSESEVSLLEVVENFFMYDNTKFHELLFVYKVDSPNINRMDEFQTRDKKEESLNKWYDISKAKEFDIRPSFAKKWFDDEDLKHEVINEIDGFIM